MARRQATIRLLIVNADNDISPLKSLGRYLTTHLREISPVAARDQEFQRQKAQICKAEQDLHIGAFCGSSTLTKTWKGSTESTRVAGASLIAVCPTSTDRQSYCHAPSLLSLRHSHWELLVNWHLTFIFDFGSVRAGSDVHLYGCVFYFVCVLTIMYYGRISARSMICSTKFSVTGSSLLVYVSYYLFVIMYL